ncbi:hypothetical protein SJX93_22430 [Streptomyces cyaneofuscatus]|uniref:hypothetical protein n=1 Tax=Streptomyces cyaneofuscatus TaxID=66883 RepID=UPI002D776A0C|nr:hypothetical protein [Streptomyces cyaneofuscatus]WRO12180.1 hypothetical protein SJX93_22430 [Streptomyces cyaneofuscatus]
MADIEELLTGTPVRLAPAAAIRARGDRRRTGRRAALAVVAVVAAGAMGLGVWGGLVVPDESGGADVAAVGPNPFKSDGVVRALDPSVLPGHEVLRWKSFEGEWEGESDTAPLPEAGLGSTCGTWSGDLDLPLEMQYTRLYEGKDGARARYRVSTYGTGAEAAKAVEQLDKTLVGCGVERAVGEPDGEYTGVTEGTGDRLNVTVTSWGTWVGVVEVQLPAESRDN